MSRKAKTTATKDEATPALVPRLRFPEFRKEEPRYSRRVEIEEIKKNDFNLNISRYISTAVGEEEIDLRATHDTLKGIEAAIQTAAQKHNAFLKELGLPLLPSP